MAEAARSFMVQELGLQMLRREGVQLVALGKPDALTAIDDPMVEAVRQMLGVMSQLEKAMTVAKLRSARDHAPAAAGQRMEGPRVTKRKSTPISCARPAPRT